MKKILIVEDETRIREDIKVALEMNNYDPLVADNGLDAIEIAKEHLPSLIISDIMMPKLNGYELLATLQKIDETASIPFLFLSAKIDKHDIRKGMNLGADDYITKPFDIDDLIVAVEARLKKKEMAEKQFQKKFEELRSSIRSILPHEIRTPLNAILGFTDFILKNPDNSLQNIEDMLSRVYSSAKRLNTLFENYLIYANLEIIATNENEIEKLTENKTIFVKNILFDIAMYKAEIHKRKRDLVLDLEDQNLKISNEFFVKAMEELIDNAFKFSEYSDEVIINSWTQDDLYVIDIIDHGRGFTPKQLEALGAYIQFDRKLYEQQGSGIGLTIAKRIAELHKGSLHIFSQKKETKVRISFMIDDQ